MFMYVQYIETNKSIYTFNMCYIKIIYYYIITFITKKKNHSLHQQDKFMVTHSDTCTVLQTLLP